MASEKTELLWLSRQRELVWGGHLLRGEPPNGDLLRWLQSGVIEQVHPYGQKPGYRLTEKGFTMLGLRAPLGLTHDR